MAKSNFEFDCLCFSYCNFRGNPLYETYVIFDILCGTASIWNMAAISIDRLAVLLVFVVVVVVARMCLAAKRKETGEEGGGGTEKKGERLGKKGGRLGKRGEDWEEERRTGEDCSVHNQYLISDVCCSFSKYIHIHTSYHRSFVQTSVYVAIVTIYISHNP
jgi:hypothetical protein